MTASSLGSGLFSNQSPIHQHLAAGSHGEKGEIGEIWRAVQALLGPMAAIAVEEFDAPAAASTTAIMAATATVVGGVTYTIGSGLTDLSGTTFVPAARNVTVTTGGATPAHAPASMTVTGLDAAGRAQTEVITPATTAATVAGVKGWSKITSVVFGAAGGTDATVSIGFGAVIGLKEFLKARSGATTSQPPISENVDHATPTAGTVDPTNRTYTPNAAPNGTHNYAVFYEYDPTKIPVLGKF